MIIRASGHSLVLVSDAKRKEQCEVFKTHSRCACTCFLAFSVAD
jgi:hypothetical protein